MFGIVFYDTCSFRAHLLGKLTRHRLQALATP